MPEIIGQKGDPVAEGVSKVLSQRGVAVELLDGNILENFPDMQEPAVVPIIHKSSSGIKCLTVHFPGIFQKKLGVAAVLLGKLLLKGLFLARSRFRVDSYDITMEATHHGPLTDTPIAFIEIGSNETSWRDSEAVKALAFAIEHAIAAYEEKVKKPIRIFAGVGGGHYARKFTEINLTDSIAIGHIASKHVLELLDEKKLKELVVRSFPKAEGIIIDWKGVPGRYRAQIIETAKKAGIKVARYRKGELREL